jgi:glutathione S-transferase
MNTTVQEDHLTTADLAGVARGDGKADPRQADQRQSNAAHPLFPEDVANDFRSRWDRVQTGFVDEPRQAVQQADELVAQAIKRLAESFAEERNRLERQWDRGDEVSTEDLRVALQTYRSFFQRLLSI